MRLVDLALPLLEAGQSLRFAVMPEGQDPDDLLKAQGAGALQKLLDAAMPMVRLLWQRETEGKVFDSPERKAALDKALREKIMLIKDPSIRSHYGQEIKDLRWQLFRAGKGGGGGGGGKPGGGKSNWNGKRAPWNTVQEAPMPTTKASSLVTDETGQSAQHLREAVILAACAGCPEVVEEFESGLEQMTCVDREHAHLRDLILRHAHEGAEVLRENIYSALGPDALANLTAQRHVAITPSIRNPGDLEMASMTVAEELAKLETMRGLSAEIAEAEEDLSGTADEGVTWRLGEAARAADQALRTGQEDKAEYEVGDNGARISREERSALDTLLGTIKYNKTDGDH